MAPHPTMTRRVNPLKRRLLEPFVRHRTEDGFELTFDDGPDPNFTPQVLDRLEKYGLRATFFVLGSNVLRHRSTLRAIHAAGHRIGNHSLTHPRSGWVNFWAIRNEIRRCQHAIEDAIGVSPTEFRPPFGIITPAVLIAARASHSKLTNWSLDSGDWSCRSAEDARRCAEETIAQLRPRDVILLHDNHTWIGPVLDRLLPALQGLNLDA